ncbi:AfsR/SARP family transcriptional regulator [Phytomonospora endophytica]|uniref:DNA-binding SARP family transcriptional activator/tetratricopeptide (TPR) repeat protein n=1 Tax=Phytomonospora endophytica TaxID=714109 RepID=A0A841FZP8_9ACTN|nr:BTAD domain-containing putative transcriptional regulator [Phytomonospora endophytica]MBB6037919.1 DNA-binding SARP family transcriptional activator/tetratricopeptide (TPR) repeat protein [Phytomonospora endophytica]GIG68819.1 SARP family transcriptional regulator [Phytomonospora endophytica]
MVAFGVLGSLDVRVDGEPVVIAGRHHPKLLAMLLVEANQVVSAERLAAGLWDDTPPATAVRQVQNIAGSLRRLLGDRLRKVGAGYRIDVAVDELDLLRSRRGASLASAHQAAGRLDEAERALGDALAEWRGPSLAGLSGRTLDMSAQRLDDYRLTLTEERVELTLRLGRHATLVGDLRQLCLAHPHRQRFAEQLMTALYRSGRGPEALRVYAEVRTRLADELGVDPGKPLRDLHTAVLREDPGLDLGTDDEPPAAPVTLPSATAAFTGRDHALAALDEAAESPSSPLVVLTGPGGVGKTMLALHWAHRARPFSGGRLYLDLRGFAPNASPLEPAEAARLLLTSLDVEPGRIPADSEARIALCRAVIGAGRRLLVLDNARDAAQVRPLLPDSSRVHTVVISRGRLAGLAASHGARIIEVESFDRTEAAALLTRQLGAKRLGTEPGSVERILTACAGLPLALALIAARAATRPGHPLSVIADELETSRLDALAVDDASVDLRSVFSWSYQSLDADAARLFRLLAVVPGPDFDLAGVARLHGGSTADARRSLGRLVEAHLVEHGPPGRHRLHDLIRDYAAELPDAGKPAALDRLLDWYLHATAACRAVLYPAMVGLPVGTDERFQPNADEAARWLKSEWDGLIAAIEHAAEHRPPEFAWLMADMLRGYTWLHMLGDDGVRISEAALTAATGAGDLLGLAAAELALACALIRSNRLEEAIGHARDAAGFARRAGWPAGAASAEGNTAIACYHRGRMRDGLEHAHAALLAYREIGEVRAECTNLHWLGLFHSLVGELDTGIEYLERALKIATEAGNDQVGAVLLIQMTEIQLHRGRFDLAAAHLDEATELERRSVSIDKSRDLLGATARLLLATGRNAEGLEHAKRVVEERTDAADHRNRAAAMVTLAAAYDAVGEHGEAVACYDRVLAMTEHDSTVFHRVEAMVGRSGALFHGGDSARSKEQAARALQTAVTGDYRFLEGQALNRLAEIDLAEGHLADAAEKARRALRICEETGHRPGETVSLRLLDRIARA